MISNHILIYTGELLHPLHACFLKVLFYMALIIMFAGGERLCGDIASISQHKLYQLLEISCALRSRLGFSTNILLQNRSRFIAIYAEIYYPLIFLQTCTSLYYRYTYMAVLL